jgi:hypothetical protein
MKIIATYGGETENFHRFVIKRPEMNGRIYILKQAEIPKELVVELEKAKKVSARRGR